MEKKRGYSINRNRFFYNKGQISIFIIIGIVFLIITALIILLLPDKTQEGVEGAVEQKTNIFQSKELIHLTETCLRDKLLESVNLIGLQGGYIYKDQTGSKIPFNVETYVHENTKVPILIQPLDTIPPSYPCHSSENIHDNPNAFCGFSNTELFPNLSKYNYGKNKLQKLYKNRGIYAIQAQIEHYLNTQIPECTNFNDLKNNSVFNKYKITEQPPVAELKLEENSISIVLDYPIRFEIPGLTAEQRTLKFSVQEDIRLKNIYQAAQEMIAKDNIFIDYNIYTDTRTGFFKNKELNFNKIRDKAKLNKIVATPEIEIIQIIDSGSNINAQPYIFQFARKNRYPVLDYIPKSYPPKKIADIAVLYNQPIEIKPIAADPDGTQLIYSYEEWKADYDEVWQGDEYSLQSRSKQNKALTRNQWTSSSDYINSKRNTKISTTLQEAGFHEVIIKASDSVLADFQKLVILVELVLRSDHKSYNFYDDVPNNWISIEDPYILDASTSTWVIDPSAIYKIQWFDAAKNSAIFQDTNKFEDIQKCILHPSLGSCDQTEDIADMSKNKLSYQYPQSDIKFKIQTFGRINQSLEKDLGLQVKQCLPHSHPTHKFAYPYHELVDNNNDGNFDIDETGSFLKEPIDPFLANHSCCKKDGEIEKDSKVIIAQYFTCYTNPRRPNPPADLAIQEDSNALKLSTPVYIIPTYMSEGDTNDIYERRFWQRCANRGNALTGEAVDEYWRHINCNDKNPSQGEDESCQGPALAPELCNNLDQNPECYSYTGTTFELEFREQFKEFENYDYADGLCNNNFKCSTSDIIGGYNNASGNYLAQATCDGRGGCTRPVNLKCQIGSCGADCSDNIDVCTDTEKPVTCDYPSGTETKTATRTPLSCTKCRCKYSAWSDPC